MGPKNTGPVETRLSRVEDTVDRLDEFVFNKSGGPNIEKRLESFVEGRVTHKKNQIDESLAMLQRIVDQNQRRAEQNEERIEQHHQQNTKKLDRLTWLAGVGVGIILTLQAVLLGKH